MRDFFRYYRYVSRYWIVILFVVLVSLASAACALPIPLLIRRIIDRALPESEPTLLMTLVGATCVFWFLSYALVVIRTYGATWLEEVAHARVRQDLFEHMLGQPPSFFEERQTGGLVSRLTNDVAAVQGLLGDLVFEALGEVCYLVGGVIVLFQLDWRLALAAMIVLPTTSAMFTTVRRRLHSAQARLQQSQQDLSSQLFESLAGLRVVKAYGLEQRESERVRDRSRDLKQVRLRKQLIATVIGCIGALIALVPTTLVVWGYGGYRVLMGALTLGTLVAFYQYLGTFFRPMSVFFRLVTEMIAALAALERIFSVLDQAPTVVDPHGEVKPLRPVEGAVDITDLYFSYVEGQDVLHRIDLKLNPGEVVGLVGPSGAGKSTLAHLLVRFADPRKGSIRLDGHDLRSLRQHDLRRHVGLVLQEVFLFDTSVRENIRIARPDASDQAVIEAAKLTGADAFIRALPDGYDTCVGERGARISGGQRQMLALARVILHNPRVLVFDEATSALDPVAEAGLQQALQAAMAGRTTLIIAHRHSTLRMVKRIIVLDEGRLVGQGTHSELLETVPVYRELFSAQALV